MILNKITVGNKLVLEIDHDPTSVSTPAPIGSQALRNNAGAGVSYLKFGVNDTDWVAYQTGVDTAGWVFADSLSNLNTSSEVRYFGTKAGDFDIVFARNNVEIMRLKSDQLLLDKNLVFGSSVQNAIVVASQSLTNKAPITIQSASGYAKIDNEANALELRYMKTNGATLASGLNQPRPNDITNPTESILEITTTVVDPADPTKYAHWIKTYRVYKANGLAGAISVELMQDDMTRRSSGMGSLRVSHAIDNAQILTSFTNAPDVNNYKISSFVKEYVAKI